jgi:pimeloyl-ACP methyl ester carboxylesterase
LATYVLVPGAWLGGWVWRDAARRLRADGHDVYPITLTGLGERVHLAQPEIDLDTHIRDVVNVFEFEDLADAILVGHSYAGAVVTGVADRVAARIAQLVYLDAAPLADGMALLDLFSPNGRRHLERTVATVGDGWRLPFPSFEELAEDASLAGLAAPECALMSRKAVAQPFGTWQQPLRLTNRGEDRFRRVLIACDDMRSLVAAGVPAISAMTAAPWHYLELATGHWPMLSAPSDLAATLRGLAS